MINFPNDTTLSLPFAYKGPPLLGSTRCLLEDFSVEEVLSYQSSGQGEHLFLHIEKKDINTKDVANYLAKIAGVKPVDIGFAGLKDKRSVSSQYFTIRAPGDKLFDWLSLDHKNIKVLSIDRHHRKIRRGKLLGNRFKIILRNLSGDFCRAKILADEIPLYGIPNYFGAQRFGKNSSNLHFAANWFMDEENYIKPEKKRMTLSAVKSYLFNSVLAKRVSQGTWDKALEGDVFVLTNSNKQFTDNKNHPSNVKRVSSKEIHPTGPLPGNKSRALNPSGQAALIESQVLFNHKFPWVVGLIDKGAINERRALRVMPKDFSFELLDDNSAQLEFFLPRGTFGTSVLREILSERSK